jgi:hypothetical protein
MSSFQERFEEEILRVGISKIANTLGIARNTVYNWIANGNAPLNMLMSLQGIMGVDVPYVLTGRHTIDLPTVGTTPDVVALSQDEKELVDYYRRIVDKDDRTAVMKLAKRCAEDVTQEGTQKNDQDKTSAKFVVHGKVGQQVETQSMDHLVINMGKDKKRKE